VLPELNGETMADHSDNALSISESFRVKRSSRVLIQFLLVIFFFSGFSALIYQVVWQRLLTLYYGVGPLSIVLIVTVYMIGLGLGALSGGYLSARLRSRISIITFVYCFVELGIGLFGILSPGFLGFLGDATAGSPYALAFLYIFGFLFIPTFLMGVTLPLLTEVFNKLVDDFLATISLLYFVNTIGAAVGAIAASYVIISLFGLMNAVYMAAAINLGVAIFVFLITKLFRSSSAMWQIEKQMPAPLFGLGALAFPLVVLTGFLAIGYEIIWFRVLGLLAKDSPYAFSTVLSVYLVGIGVGSFSMMVFLGHYQKVNRTSLFFGLQFLVGLSVALIFVVYYYLTKGTAFGELTRASFVTRMHPHWHGWGAEGNILGTARNLFLSFDILIWPAIFILIPTLFMGASFPLVAYLALTKNNSEGRTVGLVYFLNIIGNAAGGVLTGLFILPWFGTEATLAAFCVTGIAFGIGARAFVPSLSARLAGIAIVVAAIATVFPRKGELYEAMHVNPYSGRGNFFLDEGVDGVIGTFQQGDQLLSYINSAPHGGRPGYVYYYETIEAMSHTPKPSKALVIGFGTGSFVEMMLKSEEIQNIVLIEVNRTLIADLRRIPLFDDMLKDPRLHLIIDDGRRYLVNSKEKFDLITTDPLRITAAYAGNLYSENFFHLIAGHLEPASVYLAFHQGNPIVAKTLASVFSYLEINEAWCISSNEPLLIDNSRRLRLLQKFPRDEQKLILASADQPRVDVTPERFFKKSSGASGTYLRDRSYVLGVTKDYPINGDWEPWTEYFLGPPVREKMRRLLSHQATLHD
jgi:spermidine synthase